MSRLPRDQSGLRDSEQLEKARKKMKSSQSYLLRRRGLMRGESDRKIESKKPKHLFAGKRKSGKTGRR